MAAHAGYRLNQVSSVTLPHMSPLILTSGCSSRSEVARKASIRKLLVGSIFVDVEEAFIICV